jgi:hypothetical protein
MPIPDDPDALRELIAADVASVFQAAFEPTEANDGFSVPEELDRVAPIRGDGATVMPWRWTGLHSGPFFEVRPTGNRVDIVGVTVVTEDGNDVRFHRIVDWLTMYRQLGLMMVCRRPQSPETFEFDDIDQPL